MQELVDKVDEGASACKIKMLAYTFVPGSSAEKLRGPVVPTLM